MQPVYSREQDPGLLVILYYYSLWRILPPQTAAILAYSAFRRSFIFGVEGSFHKRSGQCVREQTTAVSMGL